MKLSAPRPLLRALFAVPFLLLLHAASALSSPSTTPSTKTKTSDSARETYRAHMRAKIAHSVAKGERRAGERVAQARAVCSSCQRPPTLCLCDVLPPANEKYSTRTQLLILQHPNERRKKNLSTVPLLKLVLEDVQVIGGYTFEPDALPPVVQEMLDRGRRPLLLYPSDDAISLDAASTSNDNSQDVATILLTEVDKVDSSHDRDCNNHDDNLLIMIDGTWNEAKRMVRDSPALIEHCQAVQFSSDSSSIYDALRREPDDHCLSTLEACAQALALLEPPSAATNTQAVVEKLHTVLQAHIDAHLPNARTMAPRSVGAATAKLYAKNRRRREIELTMFSSLAESGEEKVHKAQATQPYAPTNETLPDGAILRCLQISDAPSVDSWWEFSSAKSLPLVVRRIEIDQATAGGSGCFGIEMEGHLVACVMRYEGGALGMLYVQERFRRRGYGLALLRYAAKILQERKEERVAFIVDGNSASEALFRAAGWERAHPQLKSKSGKRKAKRRWIHK